MSDLALRRDVAVSRPGRRRSKAFRAAVTQASIATVSLAVGLGVWYWATRVGAHWFIRFDNVPTPYQVGAALWRHLGETRFYLHIAVSLRRILIAYAIATVLGIALGLVAGRSRLLRSAMMRTLRSRDRFRR